MIYTLTKQIVFTEVNKVELLDTELSELREHDAYVKTMVSTISCGDVRSVMRLCSLKRIDLASRILETHLRQNVRRSIHAWHRIKTFLRCTA